MSDGYSYGYGTHTAKCGRCGDSYSASGICGDIDARDWLRKHKRFECDKRTEQEIAEADEEIKRRLAVNPFTDMMARHGS